MPATEGFDELDDKLGMLADMADIIEKDVAPGITEAMRDYAVDMVTKIWGAVDTGALRNSIESSSQFVMKDGDAAVEMGISATSDHINYIEFGTGIHGSATYTDVEGGTHTAEGVSFKPIERWYQHNPEYQGDFGKNNDPRRALYDGFSVGASADTVEEWIPRYSQHPRPIMRPALYDNIPVFEDMIAGKLGGIFDD